MTQGGRGRGSEEARRQRRQIAGLALPFVVVGLIANLASPAIFQVGGPPPWLRALSVAVLGLGLVLWMWSVILILRDVPRGRLITGGPYAWVKHPIYTAVALLVLPSAGFLLNSWLGALLGAVLYVGSRIFARSEEADLSGTFGETWLDYSRNVKLRWL